MYCALRARPQLFGSPFRTRPDVNAGSRAVYRRTVKIEKGKRVRVIGRLEYQSWNDKTTGELRTRAVIVASQVLFLDYDRAHIGLAEEPEAEEQPVEAVAQPEAEAPSRPKRSRRKQAA